MTVRRVITEGEKKDYVSSRELTVVVDADESIEDSARGNNTMKSAKIPVEETAATLLQQTQPPEEIKDRMYRPVQTMRVQNEYEGAVRYYNWSLEPPTATLPSIQVGREVKMRLVK